MSQEITTNRTVESTVQSDLTLIFLNRSDSLQAQTKLDGIKITQLLSKS